MAKIKNIQTFLSNIDANSNKIINLADPTSAQEAATKAYVDSHGGGGSGTVTSVGLSSTGSTLSISGSPITTSGTINADLATTAVTAGSYSNASITVDAYGRLTAASSGSFVWSTVTGTSQTLVANSAYIANNASLITFTLPTTASVGDTFSIIGLGAGGYKIAQNASQLIRFGSSVTTTGTGGSLATTNQYDTIRFVCIVANTTFSVLDAISAGFTVV